MFKHNVFEGFENFVFVVVYVFCEIYSKFHKHTNNNIKSFWFFRPELRINSIL